MKIGRRDLLKYFGIGSAIIPIVGGAPIFEAEAKLVKPAEVEPVQAATMSHGIVQSHHGGPPRLAKISVEFPDGTTYCFESDDAVIETENIEVTALGDKWRRYLPGASTMRATLYRSAYDYGRIEYLRSVASPLVTR